jgi:hypothetical protein
MPEIDLLLPRKKKTDQKHLPTISPRTKENLGFFRKEPCLTPTQGITRAKKPQQHLATSASQQKLTRQQIRKKSRRNDGSGKILHRDELSAKKSHE